MFKSKNRYFLGVIGIILLFFMVVIYPGDCSIKAQASSDNQGTQVEIGDSGGVSSLSAPTDEEKQDKPTDPEAEALLQQYAEYDREPFIRRMILIAKDVAARVQQSDEPSSFSHTFDFFTNIGLVMYTYLGGSYDPSVFSAQQTSSRNMSLAEYFAYKGVFPTFYDASLALMKAPLYMPDGVGSRFYAQNFVPKQVSDIINTTDTRVNAATFLLIGSPPDASNTYSVLARFVGVFWLEVFKLVSGVFVLVLMAVGIAIIFNQKIKGQTPITVMMVLRNLVIGYIGAFLSFGIGVLFFNLSKFFILWQGNLVKNVYFEVTGGNRGDNSDYIPYNGLNFWLNVLDLKGVIAFPGGLLQTADFVWDQNVRLVSLDVGKGLGEIVGRLGFAGTFGAPLWAIHYAMWIGAGILSVPLGGVFRAIDNFMGISGRHDVIGDFASFWGRGIAWLFGLFIGLFYMVAALLSIIRLFVSLIKTYLMMSIDIIFGPLVFMLGVIPGNEGMYKSWIKRMFSRSLAPAFAYFLVNLGMMVVVLPIVWFVAKLRISTTGTDVLSLLTGGILNAQLGGAKEIITIMLNVPIITFLVLLNMAASAETMLTQMFGIQEGALGKIGLQALSKVPIIGRFAKTG